MADTRVHREAEAWIVGDAIQKIYGRPFSKRRLKLVWGGSFEFDGVSADGKIVVCVSTSASRTASKGLAVGKIQKIKADALYLFNALNTEFLVMVFTDRGMMEYFQNESRVGRFPTNAEIELRFVPLPQALSERLRQATRLASTEVSPKPGR